MEVGVVGQFPSLKAGQLERILRGKPLLYRPEPRTSGSSHRLWRSAAGYPDLLLTFHPGISLSPHVVRKVLVNDVGLSVAEALALL